MLPQLEASYWRESWYWTRDGTLAIRGGPRCLIKLLPKALGTQAKWSTKWLFSVLSFYYDKAAQLWSCSVDLNSQMQSFPAQVTAERKLICKEIPRPTKNALYYCAAASQGYFYADEEIKTPAETNLSFLFPLRDEADSETDSTELANMI